MVADVDNVIITNTLEVVLPVDNANLESNDMPHLAKKLMSYDINLPESDTNVHAIVQHTIYMTTDYYKCLMTPKNYLPDTYSKHDVVVCVKNFGFGVIFHVMGKPLAHTNFRTDLINYNRNQKIESKKRLIKFFQNEINQIKLPITGNTILEQSEHSGVCIEWYCYGSIFIVKGTTQAQNNFRNRLLAYCQYESSQKKWMQRPQNRMQVIQNIKEKLKELEKSHGNVSQLYKDMCMYESDMNTYREADCVRVLVNVILMGQAGLRDGPYHLKSLQLHLKSLLDSTHRFVPMKIQKLVFRHYNYIFSPFRHDDYPGLINEYEATQTHRRETDFRNRSADGGGAALPVAEANLELDGNLHPAI